MSCYCVNSFDFALEKLHSCWSARAIFPRENRTNQHSSKTCCTTELDFSIRHLEQFLLMLLVVVVDASCHPEVEMWTPFSRELRHKQIAISNNFLQKMYFIEVHSSYLIEITRFKWTFLLSLNYCRHSRCKYHSQRIMWSHNSCRCVIDCFVTSWIRMRYSATPLSRELCQYGLLFQRSVHHITLTS